MFLTIARPSRVGQRVLDYSHYKPLIAPTAVTIRPKISQEGSIRQMPDRFQFNVAGHSSQEFSLTGTGSSCHIEAMEPCVPHQQHPFAYRTQEASSHGTFTSVTGPEASIDDGVRAALGQVDGFDLWEGSITPLTGRMAAESLSVLGGIRHIFGRAIDSHKPQSEQEGARGSRSGHRLTNPMKQIHNGASPQTVPRLADSTLVGNYEGRVGPNQAQPFEQPYQDLVQGLVTEQIHTDDEQQCELSRELTSPLLFHSHVCHDALNHRAWNHSLYSCKGDIVGEFGFLGDVSYHESHRVTPFLNYHWHLGFGRLKHAINSQKGAILSFRLN
jgi:hypothetical protein